MPYPIWSVFTRHLRKLITAVEGHYRSSHYSKISGLAQGAGYRPMRGGRHV
jgi:hypothetical protein